MAMRIRTIGYFFKEAFSSLRRNGLLVLASMGTVAITLMIFGGSLLLVVNANNLAGTVEDELTINVYLSKTASPTMIKDVGEQINEIQGIRKVDYISKEAALEQLKESFKEKKGVLNTLKENNPLPDAYTVKVLEAKKVEEVANQVKKIPGVDKANYGQEVVEKVLAITNWIRTSGTVIMVLLGVAAVFLISTTIRLTVFARRRDIEIMKYLGGTNWFIRWPFILEGLIIGLLGSGLAVMIVYFSYSSLVDVMSKSLYFIPLQKDTPVIWLIYESILAIGAGLGVLGSFISVRKFLKV